MEQSQKVIYIYFHTSRDNVGKLAERRDVGETITYADYINRLEGKADTDFDKKYKFNENTGEYEQTSEWNNSVIVIYKDHINERAELFAGINKIPIEQAKEGALAETGSHEGKHTLQKWFDFFNKKKNAQGKYVNQSKTKSEKNHI